jgi:hypothetical protein
MDLQSEIKHLLESNSKELVSAEGAFCTGYFLVAEFVDSNGEYYSYSTQDPTMPAWRIEGLVNYELTREETEEGEDYA